ncbi:hypothetical protein [Bacillus pumilus]|uniref:hypothetical protein n=1 Tax=Bacillus pumilus TaxID=1408 RepID=UPI00192E4CF5|nr:hypothetical protein [Bacillus pumilus]
MAVLNPASIPLSLYIHMPWCVRKCPYCDFNSHAVPDGALSSELEQTYLKALVADFGTQLEMAQGRSIHSVFILSVKYRYLIFWIWILQAHSAGLNAMGKFMDGGRQVNIL